MQSIRASSSPDDVAAALRLLSGLGSYAPPSQIARVLAYPVETRPLPGGRRGLCVEDSDKILVAPLDTVCEREFVVAHELIHQALFLHGVRRHDEAWVDRAAAALILPREAFALSLLRYRFDLPVLKRVWRWASYETILWRTRDLVLRSAAAKWLDGALIERRGSRGLSSAERIAVHRLGRRRYSTCHHSRAMALAWAVPQSSRPWAVSLAFFR